MKIAIGPVFIESQGMPRYILGIKKYSSHEVSLVPNALVRFLLINPSLKVDARIDLYKKYLAKRVEKKRLRHFDVFHSQSDPWLIDLCKIMRSDDHRWVHTYHSVFVKEDYPSGLKLWQKKTNKYLLEVASKADVKISVSKWLHDYLEDNYSVQTEVVFNGLDLDCLSAINKGKFTKKYGLKNFIMFIGRLDTCKNPALFVELAARMPELVFVMVGQNLDAISLKSYLGVTIPENIVFMGELKHEDTLDALSACGVLVMTSKHEGCPTVLLEAIALGKPFVAPASGGCREIAQNTKGGFLFDPDSIDDLVEATMKALDSKQNVEVVKERMRQLYDWSVLAKKIDKIYES